MDLLNEAIAPALTRLALPIMATSLVQMLYNLTDMAWIGRLGAGAVTAVGSAGIKQTGQNITNIKCCQLPDGNESALQSLIRFP